MKAAPAFGMAAVVDAAAATVFVVGADRGFAQPAAPTGNKGITIKVLEAIDLGPQFQAMTGRQLRMRLVTAEPGGIFGIHDHKDRPAEDYVLQGAVIDHRGSQAKEYRAGMSIFEDKDTVHWLENKGTTPAVLVSVDIFKP